MRKIYQAALALTAAAAIFLGVTIYRSHDANSRLNGHLLSRQLVESFFAEAPGYPAWTRPAALPGETTVPDTGETETVYGSYAAPEGFELVSFSAVWDDGMMKQLYEELIANVHGGEIEYLEKVIVHAESEKEDVLGMQQQRESRCNVILSHPTLLPDGFSLNLKSRATILHLYNGDTRTTVESMAVTLSHEYGHHYTNFYFFDPDNPQGWLESDYARIRSLPPDRVYAQIADYDFYIENHPWYIQEIAADDYVVLMGSPMTRQATACGDVYDWLIASMRGEELPDRSRQSLTAFNIMPHENMTLAFPTRVEGLSEFYFGFIRMQPPAAPDLSQPILISVQPITRSFRLVSGYMTYRYAKITWNCPYQEGDPVYTLVCYDENDKIVAPVKTVGAGEEGTAYIGNVCAEDGKLVYSMDDGLALGVRRFRVTLILGDSGVYVSDPVDYDFGG